ncbi:MAG: hypothetical protein K6F00_11240 [Lachnospiraceae bacterium]|nr:hypothetical protein [Lachnospiraceae bacterium]
MKISEAKYKANKKWNAANYEQISLMLPKGTRDIINRHCEALGISKNQYILALLEREIPELAREMEARRSEKD